MGLNTALEFASSTMSLENQLAMHFSTNLYPPVPHIMIKPSIEALEACWEEDWYRDIELPQGVLFRDGGSTAPAKAFIDNFRLDAWLGEEYDDEEDFQ